MSSNTSWLNYVYKDFWDEYGDPLVEKYPLMKGGPWKVLSLVALYLFTVKVALPQFMKDRKAYDLLWLIRVYNVGMTLWNLWGFSSFMAHYSFLDIWKCPQSSNEYIVWIAYMFFASRLAEFADTVFFILRNKTSQVSNLHVFHHSVVPLSFWSVYKFYPIVQTGIYPVVNSFIHVLMYSYYTLSSFGPRVVPLAAKRCLTMLQILQFMIIIVHSVRFVVMPQCGVQSKYFILISIFMGGIFIYLFREFYRQAYKLKPRKAEINGNYLTANPHKNNGYVNNGKCD